MKDIKLKNGTVYIFDNGHIGVSNQETAEELVVLLATVMAEAIKDVSMLTGVSYDKVTEKYLHKYLHKME